jgi:hypothetical protein
VVWEQALCCQALRMIWIQSSGNQLEKEALCCNSHKSMVPSSDISDDGYAIEDKQLN